MSIIDYTTAAACGLAQLESAVNDLINQGWEPQGGISVIVYVENDRNGFPEVNKEYFQALVKYEEE